MVSENGTQRCRAPHWVRVALGLVLSLGASPVGAEARPSEAEKEMARTLMEEGDDAYDAGRYTHALKSYRRADSIVGVPTTGLAVANALAKLGKLREAREVAARVANSRPVAGEPRILTEARKQAAAFARDLDRAIPTLHVGLTGTPATKRASLTVDGVLVSTGAFAPVSLDPGVHHYRVTADGYVPILARVVLQRNERRRVEHVLVPLSKPSPRPVDAPASTPVLAYVGFGVGGAGVLAGTTTGILSLSRAASAKEQCDGTSCWPEARGDADTSKKLATASNISFGVGLVGLGIGLASLLSSSSEKATSPETGYALQITSSHTDAGFRVIRVF